MRDTRGKMRAVSAAAVSAVTVALVVTLVAPVASAVIRAGGTPAAAKSTATPAPGASSAEAPHTATPAPTATATATPRPTPTATPTPKNPRYAKAPRVSDTAARPWQPPPEAMKTPAPRTAGGVPARWLEPGAKVGLVEVIDLALRNNPATRSAWHEARAASAHLSSTKGAYLPEVDLTLEATRVKTTALDGTTALKSTSAGPSVALHQLLLDFGTRSGDVEVARNALYEANWIHNAAIQRVILLVTAKYYDYEATKGLLQAARASLEASEASLDAANYRHRAGVATVADFLQAKTARSEVELTIETLEGRIQTIRGELATAVGVSPGIPVDVEELPKEVHATETLEDVDRLLERARIARPDLLAARAHADSALGHVRSVKGEGLPSLEFDASPNRLYYPTTSGSHPSDNYTATLALRIPVFRGFSNQNDIREARELAEVARADARTLEDQVVLQVWTSYYNLKTAARRLVTARDLLESATQSADVARGRYQAGVGSILDRLTVESALANARAAEVQARADWLLGLAALAYDTGSLEPPIHDAQVPPEQVPQEQEQEQEKEGEKE